MCDFTSPFNYSDIKNGYYGGNIKSDYKLYLKFNYEGTRRVFITANSNYHYFGYKSYNTSWYNRIEMYLKQLLGSNNTIPASIDTVTDTVSDQIDDITQFEDTYNQI